MVDTNARDGPAVAERVVVVNCQRFALGTASPESLRIAVPNTTVNVTPAGSAFVGTKVIVRPCHCTFPASAGVMAKLASTDALSGGLEKTALITALRGTSVA